MGDDGHTTYPLCPGWREPYYSPACTPGVRGQAAALEWGDAQVEGSASAHRGAHCPPWGLWCAHHTGHGSLLPGKMPALPICSSWLWDTLTCTGAMVQGVALGPGNVQLGPAASPVLSQARTSWPHGKTALVPTALKQAWGQGDLLRSRRWHPSQHIQPHCYPSCVPTSRPLCPPSQPCGTLQLHRLQRELTQLITAIAQAPQGAFWQHIPTYLLAWGKVDARFGPSPLPAAGRRQQGDLALPTYKPRSSWLL